MKDPVVSGLIAALLVAMAVGLYLFYLPRRRRPTAMEIEHSEFRKKQNEQLWAENTELKQKLEAAEKERNQAQDNFRQQFDLRQTANAKVLELQQSLEAAEKERDKNARVVELLREQRDKLSTRQNLWSETAEKIKVQRDEYKVKAESLAPTLRATNNQLKTAEKERDEARALANDLREYLDRSLAIINEQNEQIRQLTPGEYRKLNQRNPDGTFKRKPVKHLRELNEAFEKGAQSFASASENIAKAFERLRPMNATQTPKVVDEHGNDLREHPSEVFVPIEQVQSVSSMVPERMPAEHPAKGGAPCA